MALKSMCTLIIAISPMPIKSHSTSFVGASSLKNCKTAQLTNYLVFHMPLRRILLMIKQQQNNQARLFSLELDDPSLPTCLLRYPQLPDNIVFPLQYGLVADTQHQDEGLLETMEGKAQQFHYIQLGQHNQIRKWPVEISHARIIGLFHHQMVSWMIELYCRDQTNKHHLQCISISISQRQYWTICTTFWCLSVIQTK